MYPCNIYYATVTHYANEHKLCKTSGEKLASVIFNIIYMVHGQILLKVGGMKLPRYRSLPYSREFDNNMLW